ncbi:MAG: hypothetical protein UY07_C0002G0043 [Parcubacteria group bacterium GW2011_GWA1_47_8]|nr:MAG: hypothetical protein UY07_C0002G0043 [Parcubacteria group bacterium GW2011_GWA1_47_8]
MNILNLLTKEKRVAGIEISDSVIRIAFFRSHKKGRRGKQPTTNTALRTIDKNTNTKEEIVLIEEPIAANIIADGVVVDVDLLSKTLKEIRLKAKLGTDYAVVAIPDDNIYSRVFSFPKTVDGTRLSEAMRLAIGFQLPMKVEDVYLDWERTPGNSPMNEILLSTIPKSVAQGYVDAIERAGIKILALESHLSSIARAIKAEPEQTTLFTKKTPDGATIFCLRDGVLRFSRALPRLFVPEEKISAEVANIKTALEADMKKTVEEASLVQARVRDEYRGATESTEPPSKWLIPLGAAIRGKMPEGTDNLISLLPVGTEEAYAYQKAATVVALIRNMTIGVSVFFMAVFLGAYFFMFSLAQNAERTIATLSASAISPELLEKEAWIEHVNELTATGQVILDGTPIWSGVLDEVSRRIIDGISVSSFSAPSITEKMSLTGTARNREILNLFKKSLLDSPLLTEIDLPITNIAQRESIPFSVSFRINDPSTAYWR